MNPLQLLMMFATFLTLCFFYRRELRRELEFCFALGQLQYNPGGLTVPLGYHVPAMPYLPPAGRAGTSFWQFDSNSPTAYNTLPFTLRRNNADGSFTAIQFEYYRAPTAAPSLPIIGINLTGYTTNIQIRNATAVALELQGFDVVAGASANMAVRQPFGGDQGDIGFFGDFNGLGLLTIGPSWNLADQSDSFALYGNTVFFGGNELAVPLRIGLNYGMAPVAPPIFDGGGGIG